MYIVMAVILVVGIIGGATSFKTKENAADRPTVFAEVSVTKEVVRIVDVTKYTKAIRKGNTVIYTADNGTKVQFVGGTLAWRTNNPGNIWAGKISKKFNAIGKYGNFAIFANIEDGRAALKGVLTITMRNMTIVKAMHQYAPPHENNTKAYTAFVVKAIGRPATTLVKDLTDAELNRMIKAIEKKEGFKAGKVITY